MKKLSVFLSVFAMLFAFAGCGEKDNTGDGSTKLFDYADLSSFVEVPEYKGLKVSSADEDFVKLLEKQVVSDLSAGGYGEEVEIASGTVEDGDTVHIVYVGKHNGEAFSGGSTGDEGTDLVIGSGTYIDGFEEGLIGAKPGEKRVLDLTFPDPYPNNTELSGAKVQFDVTVQTVKRTKYPEIDAEIAKVLGYESVDEYNAAARKAAAESYIYTKLTEEAVVKSVPQTELDYFVDNDVNYYKSYASQMGYTFEKFLEASNMDEETFKSQITENYKSNMNAYMLIYYIAKQEKLTVTAEELEAEYASLAKQYSMEVSAVKEQIDEKQVEYSLIYENVMDFLVENADID